MKIKKHFNYEACGEDNEVVIREEENLRIDYHLLNMFEHYIYHPKDFNKSELKKVLKKVKQKYKTK